MIALIFVNFCLLAVAHVTSDNLIDVDSGARTRQGAIECSLPFVDVDGDGRASKQEVQRAHYMAMGRFRHVLSALEWIVRKVPLVNLETVDQVMEDCDYDKDGFISRADYDKTTNSCLNNQRKIELVYDWLCVPGAKGDFQYFQQQEKQQAETATAAAETPARDDNEEAIAVDVEQENKE